MTVSKVYKLPATRTINRTIVELKYKIVPDFCKALWAINRTIVELKFQRLFFGTIALKSINRTIVELKLNCANAKISFFNSY